MVNGDGAKFVERLQIQPEGNSAENMDERSCVGRNTVEVEQKIFPDM